MPREVKADKLIMQKHVMLVKKAVAFATLWQTIVLEDDYALYARQKRYQLLFPEGVGEQQMVYMMGFLHLHMSTQEAERS